jgi:hypothetical protein
MPNLLPLDIFRSILGFHPWHFWGMADNSLLAVTSACNGIVTEYPWQATDAAGRAEIRDAIEQAEKLLAGYLGFYPAPRYTNQTVPWPRYLDASLSRTGPRDPTGRWLAVQLPEGQIRAAGVESLTAATLGAAVVLSDPDGDTYNEKFTIGPIPTTITDPAEVAVYFAAADRFDGPDFSSAVGDHWRIQPVNVTISGGNLTITGARWLLVPPLKYQGLVGIGSGLNPATVGNVVTTLDIYQRTTNQNGITTNDAQTTIIWETHPWWPQASWWCQCGCTTPVTAYGGSPFDPSAIAQAAGRVDIHNAESGIVAAAQAAYDATTGIFTALNWDVCTEPDRVIIRYLAGYPLASDGQMQEPYRTIVARLAAAELARPICACDEANRELYRWQFDLARTAGSGDEAYGAVSAEDLNNPFGTRRGHVYAWKQVRNLRQLRGFLP